MGYFMFENARHVPCVLPDILISVSFSSCLMPCSGQMVTSPSSERIDLVLVRMSSRMTSTSASVFCTVSSRSGRGWNRVSCRIVSILSLQ